MGETKSKYAGKKIGIIGLGSIGIKHATHLIDLGVEQIYALRSHRGAIKVLPPTLHAVVKQLEDEEAFFASNLDGIIISNPTSMHLSALNKCLNRGLPTLVEKPIFSALEETTTVLASAHHLIRVGFCLRFHPLTQKITQLLKTGILGALTLSRMNVGQYLPSWHPYTDYRKEYFSKKELGGGALRTLSHEIDLMLFLFGKPQHIDAQVKKTSALEIDVDDFSTILAHYPSHLCRIEMDFLSRRAHRQGSIIGDNGELYYDFITGSLAFHDNEGNVKDYSKEVPDVNMYTAQLEDFLHFVDNGISAACSFGEAVESMKIIAEAENSFNKKE
jgi:predicted dehydrogenase